MRTALQHIIVLIIDKRSGRSKEITATTAWRDLKEQPFQPRQKAKTQRPNYNLKVRYFGLKEYQSRAVTGKKGYCNFFFPGTIICHQQFTVWEVRLHAMHQWVNCCLSEAAKIAYIKKNQIWEMEIIANMLIKCSDAVSSEYSIRKISRCYRREGNFQPQKCEA